MTQGTSLSKQEIRASKAAAHAERVSTLPEFHGFGKVPRLNRDIIITEKIDGTNAAVGVTEDGRVYAQSRTRIITPYDDNYGFAAWVENNADALREGLGPGIHFGEWWGQGINRGYRLDHRRFSLFNVSRWQNLDGKSEPAFLSFSRLTLTLPAVSVVPVLYRGPWVFTDSMLPLGLNEEFSTQDYNRFAPEKIKLQLKLHGSRAVPGFMNPEGFVVYHTKGGVLFKVTLDKDEEYKGGQRDRDNNPV